MVYYTTQKESGSSSKAIVKQSHSVKRCPPVGLEDLLISPRLTPVLVCREAEPRALLHHVHRLPAKENQKGSKIPVETQTNKSELPSSSRATSFSGTGTELRC